MMHVKIDEFIF